MTSGQNCAHRPSARPSWVDWGRFCSFLTKFCGARHKVLRSSPFANVPKFPGADLDIVPLIVLVSVALVLTTFGVNGFRRRDIG